MGHDQRHRLLGTEAPVHRLLRSSATDKGGKDLKNNGVYRISRSIDNLYASHSEGETLGVGAVRRRLPTCRGSTSPRLQRHSNRNYLNGGLFQFQRNTVPAPHAEFSLFLKGPPIYRPCFRDRG